MEGGGFIEFGVRGLELGHGLAIDKFVSVKDFSGGLTGFVNC